MKPMVVSASEEDALRQAVAVPRFFGQPSAPHTLYVYTNPQCPPCRRDWPALRAVLAQLDPAQVQVVISGFGFSDSGTRLLYTAALLAACNQEAGLAFLDAVFAAGTVPYIEGSTWIFRWLDATPLLKGFNRDVLSEPELAQIWLVSTRETVASLHLAYTPSYVLNRQVLPGLPTRDELRVRMHGE